MRLFECGWPGCDRHPGTTGDAIFRVTPKGGPFGGFCAEHLRQFEALAPDARSRMVEAMKLAVREETP